MWTGSLKDSFQVASLPSGCIVVLRFCDALMNILHSTSCSSRQVLMVHLHICDAAMIVLYNMQHADVGKYCHTYFGKYRHYHVHECDIPDARSVISCLHNEQHAIMRSPHNFVLSNCCLLCWDNLMHRQPNVCTQHNAWTCLLLYEPMSTAL